ncbi:hypothetical protein GCM10027195_43050 [Comamonas sediminis]
MQDETKRRYLFVAIGKATRWVFVQIRPAKTAAGTKVFLRGLHKVPPTKITRLLTCNGKEFTHTLFASWQKSLVAAMSWISCTSNWVSSIA